MQKMVRMLIHYYKHCIPLNVKPLFSAKESDFLKYTEETA